MKIIIKIAIRNVILNKKQSLRIGLSIFICTFIILICSSILNGVQNQIMENYLNIQSADVVVVWEELKEIGNIEPSRLLFPDRISFDISNSADNKVAIIKMNEFLDKHQEEIQDVFFNIRGEIELQIQGKKDNTFSMYSLTEDNKEWLLNRKGITLIDGELLSADNNGVCISQEKASEHNLKVGDIVTGKVRDIQGVERKVELIISGIYENKAEYENTIIFLTDSLARKLAGYNKTEFDIVRIYLKERKNSTEFAKRLDDYITEESTVLRAENYVDASLFFTQLTRILKVLYVGFFGFILFIIALGLRSSVRMNLFSRMLEFGTLRAIGYSKLKCYCIIFLEVYFLAAISLAVSLSIVVGVVCCFSTIGIYVGSGGATYFFGGEMLYPQLRMTDVVLIISLIFLFSILSSLSPAINLLYQNITDIMAKRQKKFYLLKKR